MSTSLSLSLSLSLFLSLFHPYLSLRPFFSLSLSLGCARVLWRFQTTSPFPNRTLDMAIMRFQD
ncbi:hypothetical protein I3842_15G101500 [Carya illinoinensis]|uniref:Secreted protein n=1 Tax=Carya illinoinensis TaxID=32201 RepID=A0A922AC75_CARIL|nr:hypothetical protein I3842_15G101500 [Carya illinoinensis]